MAVLAIFTGAINRAQYDALSAAVNWKGNQPAGGVFHAASFDAAGNIHVADVWESAESLDAFVSQRLMPAMQTLNLHPPEVVVYPAHTVQAYPTIAKYRV